MLTERLVKWSKEAQEFFEKAEDNSLDLTVMISWANESQTGEGFCELVNSLNSEDINRKIKKVSILDTTYLYRHYISEFAQHLDDTIPTIWFLSNQNVIKKIKSNLIIESYHKQVHSDIFKCWQEKILSDVYGDENGNGIVEDFKELLMQEAE
ncbi:MAG: hypothetical protein LBC22_02535, partial [Endomicrobium sp.]|nr:hypothetical protein [Endomicrobium sp.]